MCWGLCVRCDQASGCETRVTSWWVSRSFRGLSSARINSWGTLVSSLESGLCEVTGHTWSLLYVAVSGCFLMMWSSWSRSLARGWRDGAMWARPFGPQIPVFFVVDWWFVVFFHTYVQACRYSNIKPTSTFPNPMWLVFLFSKNWNLAIMMQSGRRYEKTGRLIAMDIARRTAWSRSSRSGPQKEATLPALWLWTEDLQDLDNKPLLFKPWSLQPLLLSPGLN